MYDDLLIYTPKFYELLVHIMHDPRIDWQIKLMINSALAYFVVPNDVIPEDEYGAVGYIDDLFLCSHVLVEIKNKVSEELLTEYWDENDDICNLVDDVNKRTKKIIKDKYNEILNFVGFKEGKKTTFSIDSKYNNRYEILRKQNKELASLLCQLIKKSYNKPSNKTTNALKDILESDDVDCNVKTLLKKLEIEE